MGSKVSTIQNRTAASLLYPQEMPHYPERKLTEKLLDLSLNIIFNNPLRMAQSAMHALLPPMAYVGGLHLINYSFFMFTPFSPEFLTFNRTNESDESRQNASGVQGNDIICMMFHCDRRANCPLEQATLISSLSP